MNVHIVTPDWESDWIIARLVAHLLKAYGWSVSKLPDESADCNIFFPYLEWRHTKIKSTLTAAWFTHREENWPVKAAQWDDAAKHLSLRMTPAKKYLVGLAQYGLSVQIYHPVELDMFRIRKRKRRKRPVLGVAGFTYKQSGRKGEFLLERLREEEGKRFVLKGAGIGWPIPTIHYPWKDMPGFYQSLDVYICTALVEGGPVPPLEALACGIPIVIPEGVGAMDELPTMEGIYHYLRSDYDDLLGAIREAVEYPGCPEELRAVVEPYTIKRWANEWEKALAIGLAASIGRTA